MSNFDKWILRQPLQKLIIGRGHQWKSTPTDLLVTLEAFKNGQCGDFSRWPGSPRVMSIQLQKWRGNLQSLGIGVSFDRNKKRRTILLWELTSRYWQYDLPSKNGVIESFDKPKTRRDIETLLTERGAAYNNLCILDKRRPPI